MAKAGDEFDQKHRVDARMVLLELRNRIPFEARKHIIGMGGVKPEDKRAGVVSLYDIIPADFGVGFAAMLARELKELAKLLPDT